MRGFDGWLNWYPATIERVPSSSEVDLSIDLGFDIRMKTRMRLDAVAVPDSRSEEPAIRAAGMTVQRFAANWVTDQPDQAVVVHVARVLDRGCTGTVWQAEEPHACLNEVLADEGFGLAEDEY